MSKYFVLILNMMILFQTLTFKIFNTYFVYNTVKTAFFIIEGSITYTGTKEIYRLKYISLTIYITFSITGILVLSYLIVESSLEYNFIYVLNELNTILSTFTNILDYFWYGSGLDKIDLGNRMM